jgi:cytochrome c peroxidase
MRHRNRAEVEAQPRLFSLHWIISFFLSACVVGFAGSSARASSEPIQPLSPPTGLDAKKVALGKKIFHDARLSRTNKVSCASCHDLKRGGVDGRRVSVGVDGANGIINSPTVFNTGLNFRQFWDGRASTLEEQVE